MQGLYIPNSRSRKNSKNFKFVNNFGGPPREMSLCDNLGSDNGGPQVVDAVHNLGSDNGGPQVVDAENRQSTISAPLWGPQVVDCIHNLGSDNGGHIPYNEQFFITRLLDELCEDTQLGNFQVVQEKTRVLTCNLTNGMTITLSANFFFRCSDAGDDGIPSVEYYYQIVFTNTTTKKISEINKYFFTRSNQALIREIMINHVVEHTDNFC